jgi:membrane peptidoglycan carboxypeptidase
MRPDGSVVAMVGGRDYDESQFNRAVQAKRQPGSAFKFFVYAAALRGGFGLDRTIDASTPDVNGWEPENYGGREFGSLSLADAFARSVNTAAVRLALQVGLDKVIGTARDFGIDAPLAKLPSLALGTSELTLLNMTAAYAAVPAGKTPVRPWGVASFASASRHRLISVGPAGSAQKPLGELQQKLLDLLRLPVERGTARQAALDGMAAGKTGTTQENRDAWFIGFNESLVTGVWVGNDDHAPMRDVTGGSLPAVIWKDFMSQSAAAQQQAPAESSKAPSTDEARAESSRQTCDYRACGSRYRSFDPDDCTYQPFGQRERRQCELGAVSSQAWLNADKTTDEQANSKALQCNYDACERIYSSFRREDCTYQPYNGGARRRCER